MGELRRIDALAGLRGLAAVLVVLSHSWTILPQSYVDGAGPFYGFFVTGNLGVTAFLVIGGFLVTRSLLDRRERTGSLDLVRFWLRRVLRICVQLFPFLLVIFVVSRVDRWDPWSHGQTERSVLSIATFRFNLELADRPMTLAGERFRPDLGHLWYLSMEQQFYVAWTFLLAWLGRTRLLLATLLAAGVGYTYLWRADVWNTLGEPGWWQNSLHTLSRADGLLLGALCAIGAPALATLAGRRPWLDDAIGRAAGWSALGGLAGIVAIVMATPYLDPYAYLKAPGFAFSLCCCAVVLGIVVAGDLQYGSLQNDNRTQRRVGPGRFAGRLLGARPLRWLGAVSFPLYIWHFPVFWAASRWARDVPILPRAAATCAVLAVIVVAAQLLLERPTARLLRHRAQRELLAVTP